MFPLLKHVLRMYRAPRQVAHAPARPSSGVGTAVVSQLTAAPAEDEAESNVGFESFESFDVCGAALGSACGSKTVYLASNQIL